MKPNRLMHLQPKWSKMARGNGEGGRGISRKRGNVAQAHVARGMGQGGPDLDNISHDNNMASK
ncbi:hypothetical protein Pyn_27607 [Prunus yedoensis var. nudiflora]|uniref:Uncharacterized protein n=1 Tax=Prunus yedoensis var. nudiflora TaxID=2094558 RepID=A0A314YWB2_PRUYE|nr:hypothetical protein Pyn_27607 [Prunus yedoensis var. nudiflora]